jgi:hypothetical protein
MADSPSRRGRRVTLASVIAAAVVVGGGLVVRGLSDDGTPSASTVASGTASASASTSATAGASARPSGAASGPASSGTVVFPLRGADLPGGSVLAACDRSSRATVATYDTASLGTVTLQCGNSSQGYEHIRVRHDADWDDELTAGTSSTRDWDDLMLTAVRTALTTPGAGYPKDAGDGKVCYAAPLRFDDGTTPPEGNVKVIVSATTDRVITAYPTSRPDC